MSYIEEKYIRATSSSHLQVTEFHGDIDVIMAMAGVDPTSLAGMLWRLHKEFDCAFAEQNRQASNVALARWMTLERPEVARWHSLFSAAFRRFAKQKSEFRIPDSSAERVMRVVGKVVDRELDHRCTSCMGKGRSGVFGGPQPICQACDGSGNRKQARLSDDEGEHQFGLWLLSFLEIRKADVARRIDQALSRFDDSKSVGLSTLPAFGDAPKPPPTGSVVDIMTSKAIARASGFGDLT